MPSALDPLQELGDAEIARLDAVERRERAAEHVVEAAVLVRALEREEVGRLLDDADRASGRGARRGRCAQSSSSVRLPHSGQKRTRSLTS